LEIDIFVNGKKKGILKGMTISNLIAQLELTPERLAVELNMQIVKRDRWSTQILSAGDRLEIVHFVGGGNYSPSKNDF
jgi:thiamine biosynthesis protein ThiS